MAIRHFTKIDDFTKEECLEIYKRAKIFQEGIKQGKNFTHLCKGKVLGTMFFQESTRTASCLQSSIIKLGGGYIGISGTSGTYLATGEEDLGDFLNSFADFCDIMAIRHKTLNLDEISYNFKIPLINAMCGKDEHSLFALGMIYTLFHLGIDLEKGKFGIYGMIKSSRPAKGLIKILGMFGATIYEDSVIEEFKTPIYIKEFVENKGGRLIKKKYEEFLPEIDFLFVTEGLPQAGEDEDLVKRYNQQFKIFTKKELEILKSTSYMMYSMPAKLTDGRRIVDKEIEKDSRVINTRFLKEWVYTIMGLITYLLKIEI